MVYVGLTRAGKADGCRHNWWGCGKIDKVRKPVALNPHPPALQETIIKWPNSLPTDTANYEIYFTVVIDRN